MVGKSGDGFKLHEMVKATCLIMKMGWGDSAKNDGNEMHWQDDTQKIITEHVFGFFRFLFFCTASRCSVLVLLFNN